MAKSSGRAGIPFPLNPAQPVYVKRGDHGNRAPPGALLTRVAVNIDSVGNSRVIDGTADSADRAAQVAGTQSGAAESGPAETLSREEYSDQVRARGSPIGQRETSPRGAADSGQPGTQADVPEGRPADGAERTGQPAERITPLPTGPDESRERDTGPGRTGISPDTRWEGAWICRMAGRSASTWTATTTGCTRQQPTARQARRLARSY